MRLYLKDHYLAWDLITFFKRDFKDSHGYTGSVNKLDGSTPEVRGGGSPAYSAVPKSRELSAPHLV